MKRLQFSADHFTKNTTIEQIKINAAVPILK